MSSSSKSLLEQQKSVSPNPKTPNLKKHQSTERDLTINKIDTDQLEKNVRNFDKTQDNIALKAEDDKRRIQMLKDGTLDEFDLEKERGPPETLKRENTCLIMEDETILIEIPYEMEYHYLMHLEKLKQQERDL